MDAEPYVRPRRHRLQPISAVLLLLVGTHTVASFAAGFDCAVNGAVSVLLAIPIADSHGGQQWVATCLWTPVLSASDPRP
jgi:hypothetical protein